MSELAFNLTGEPFEVPGAAIGWRVRKMKPKGAPEVVYSRDGVPLILPIEADIDDLRRATRSEGRYRLDPVDEHNRMIKEAPAGYVCVQPGDAGSESAPLSSRATSDNVTIEAMRFNTDLAKSIVDRFPLMMEAAAGLLRAADGAGLPARQPLLIVNDDKNDDDQEDESDDAELDYALSDEPAAKPTTLQTIIETIAPFVMPAIMSAIAGGKIKIPGGIGALLDPRPPSAKARATAGPRTAHQTSTPGVVPAPGPCDPAPAAGGVASSHVAARRVSVTTVAVPKTLRTAVSVVPRAAAKPAAVAPVRAATPREPAIGAAVTAPIGTAPPREGVPAVSPWTSPLSIDPHGDAPAPSAPISPHTSPGADAALRYARPAHDAVFAPAGRLELAPASPTGAVDDAAALGAAAAATSEPPADKQAPTDPAPAADAPEDALATVPASDTPDDDELPILDSGALAHFGAIQGVLTFREGILARALAAELSSADLCTWFAELRQLSVADAVAKIRAILGTDETGNDTGGVS